MQQLILCGELSSRTFSQSMLTELSEVTNAICNWTDLTLADDLSAKISK